MSKFAFTEPQAEAIVSLRLYRLTNTDITALKEEAEELSKKIQELEAILSHDKKLLKVITSDLKKLKRPMLTADGLSLKKRLRKLKSILKSWLPLRTYM